MKFTDDELRWIIAYINGMEERVGHLIGLGLGVSIRDKCQEALDEPKVCPECGTKYGWPMSSQWSCMNPWHDR